MRITMISIGSAGDVYPYIALGKELTRRGHTITLAAFAKFESLVRSAGLQFFALPGNASRFIESIMQPDTNIFNYLSGFEKEVVPYAIPMVEAMTASCENAEMVVCTFFGDVTYSIAEKFRIPCVQTHYYPMDSNDITPIPVTPILPIKKGYNEMTYKVSYLAIGLLEKKLIGTWRSENGLPSRKVRPYPDYTVNGHTMPVIYALSESLFPRPDSWCSNTYITGFWREESPVHYTPEEGLRKFLNQPGDKVYIGFGSMNSGDMGKTLAIVTKAVHAAKVKAVLAKGWGGPEELAQNDPDIYYMQDFVPHDWLFEQVDAVVHHGGAGTTASGLLAGCPTLIIPFGGDQPFWGSRIREMGFGPKPIRRESLTAEKLARGLTELLHTPEYRTAAREVSEKLRREHGVQKAADIIESEGVLFRQMNPEIRPSQP